MYPTPQPSSSLRRGESGVALIAALIILVLISAMLIGFMAMINSDTRAMMQNRDQTTAYAAAHGGLEQLTASLGQLFATNYRPTNAQVNALVATAPTFPASLGISFVSPGGGSGYTINFQDTTPADGFPDTEPNPRHITEGPYQGLQGVATPFTIEVTARTTNGGEARMRREMFTMLIPAFQFGVFSDNDLSFFAGPTFDFGGAVHTNRNLFLAEGNGNTLWLRDRVTAVGEVVRLNLSNGWLTSHQLHRHVNIARYSGDTTGDTLLTTEGSWAASTPQLPPLPVPGVTPAPGENSSPAWTTTSVTKFRGNLKNARTGARPLVLPLVQMGAQPIDLVRRPLVNSNEDIAQPTIFGQRYFARASLRILLSDNAADLANLPGVTATAPVDLSTLLGAAGGGAAWYANAANRAGRGCACPANRLVEPGERPIRIKFPGWWRQRRPVLSWHRRAMPTARHKVAAPATTTRASAAGMRPAPVSSPVSSRSSCSAPTGPGSTSRRRSWAWASPAAGSRVAIRATRVNGFVMNNTTYYLNDYVWGSAPDNGVAKAAQSCPNDISPNAVIRIQRVRDDHNPMRPCGFAAAGHREPEPEPVRLHPERDVRSARGQPARHQRDDTGDDVSRRRGALHRARHAERRAVVRRADRRQR